LEVANPEAEQKFRRLMKDFCSEKLACKGQDGLRGKPERRAKQKILANQAYRIW
jgi:phytoene/squalene synthetase